ncbi:hypothetical protein PCANC_27935 [Puccinia coronata f. sp. avenae]|uniref:ATPase dynein-related AAA domain-containing protein n=1 Tax=Puccinia coronata f. sp. avenae TaxID=200324 RepID=A0A2N5TPU0_9BASI|nr:hypothetical protein PCANC_27935 [Puccinia coronata f. sp. avenae]
MNFTINPDSLYQVITLPKSLVATNAVLLVGDAGSGKTSVCEALSSFANQRLRSVNLHRNSEVGNLLGSQRQFGSAQRRFEFWSALEQVRTSVSKGMASFPIWPAAQPGLTESIIASMAGSASENRSRLCRSSSLSSHLRRQPARDLEGEPVLAQPLRRARSRGSKSQTMMENSNSSTRTLLG